MSKRDAVREATSALFLIWAISHMPNTSATLLHFEQKKNCRQHSHRLATTGRWHDCKPSSPNYHQASTKENQCMTDGRRQNETTQEMYTRRICQVPRNNDSIPYTRISPATLGTEDTAKYACPWQVK